MRLQAGDGFGRDDALMARLMSEPGRPDAVADRPNTVNIGAAIFVDDHVPALHRDAQRPAADILGIGNDAHCDDDVAEITWLARSAADGPRSDDRPTASSLPRLLAVARSGCPPLSRLATTGK